MGKAHNLGLTDEERSRKLSELRSLLLASSGIKAPEVEDCEELQPIIREVKRTEEMIRER